MILNCKRTYVKSEWPDSIEINWKDRITCIILLITISACISFVSADGVIYRSIDTTNPQPGSVIKVSLQNIGTHFSGIVETIPQGFEFKNASLSSSGIRKNGNSVIFATIDENTLDYTLKVPESGSGTITGVYTDITTSETKKISDTLVVVQGSSADSTHPQKEASGFLLITSVCAVLIGSIISIYHRRK